jgi:transposase-like protein
MEKKERTYVDRRRVKQIEDEIMCVLGENVGFRRTIDILKNEIEINKNRVKKLQDEKDKELIGALRGIPVGNNND